jgi:flagellar basal-body rod protein FlgC
MLESSVPLSGIQAATLRLGASASNVAIMAVTRAFPARGFTSAAPQGFEVQLEEQTADTASGGTSGTLTSAEPSFVLEYRPGAPYANALGLGAPPSVNVLNELLDIATAETSFTANAKVAGAMSQMAKQVFETGDGNRSR